MNNQDLLTILAKIQDHLNENDRKQLNFLLGQDNSLRTGDLDKISREDITYL